MKAESDPVVRRLCSRNERGNCSVDLFVLARSALSGTCLPLALSGHGPFSPQRTFEPRRPEAEQLVCLSSYLMLTSSASWVLTKQLTAAKVSF